MDYPNVRQGYGPPGCVLGQHRFSDSRYAFIFQLSLKRRGGNYYPLKKKKKADRLD